MLGAMLIAATLVPLPAAAAWPTYHLDLSRTGNSPGQPFTRSLTNLWSRAVDGDVYAEPLAVGNSLIVATENNSVYALDPATGGVQWGVHLGTPVPQSQLPCGNIDPVGMTGTPTIDAAAGVIYVIGLVWAPPNAASIHYQLFALNLNNRGSLLWQRSIAPGGSPTFDARVEGQRGALALNGGTIYVPFGGRAGDCGNYRGWVVGAPASGSGNLLTYQLPSANAGGGFWSSGGPAVDASGNVLITSGNTFCTGGCAYDSSESVLKLSAALGVSDYFVPSNWSSLNASDTDLGSVSPALLGTGLVFQVGKEGVGYLLNTSSLGGTNHSTPAFTATVCNQTSDAAFGGTAYAPPYLYVPCHDRLEALNVTTGATPSFTSAWHGPAVSFSGPPIVANNLVWTIDPGGVLYGLDALTGSTVSATAIGQANHFATPTADGGRLYVAAGSTVHGYNLTPWFQWEQLGGPLTSGTDVASWGASRLDVFARGADQSLMHKSYDGTTWTAWESLGGVLGGSPGAVSWASGRIDAFVRGTDNQLWHRWYAGGSWFPWESLGGNITSGPDVASWASGRLDVFARGADNSLMHKWYSATGWSGWESLGGVLGGSPGAVSWASGRLDVFVRGTDSQLWHRWYQNAWSAWESLGGTITSGPDVSSWASGRLDVFARGADGALWHRWYDIATGWLNWETLGGQIADRPGAASWTLNRIDVLVEGQDGALWHRWVN
jgi:hypothetical protein